MAPQIVTDLLKEIYKYYPIGMPSLARQYDGYELLTKQIENKINRISNNTDSSWHQLLAEIKKKFPKYGISDFGHFQFPNYFVTLELKTNETDDIIYTKSLVLNISLLVNFYAIYFEDLVKVKKKASQNSGSMYYNVVYFNSCVEEDCFKNALDLKKTVGKYFESHSFIEHKILFDYKIIGGNMYGDENDVIQRENSIYQYLFNNQQAPMAILE